MRCDAMHVALRCAVLCSRERPHESLAQHDREPDAQDEPGRVQRTPARAGRVLRAHRVRGAHADVGRAPDHPHAHPHVRAAQRQGLSLQELGQRQRQLTARPPARPPARRFLLCRRRRRSRRRRTQQLSHCHQKKTTSTNAKYCTALECTSLSRAPTCTVEPVRQ